MAEKRRFVSGSIRTAGIFDVLIFLGLGASWLGLLGRWHWTLDLLSHFRWQYLAACIAALIWTLWQRRRRMVAISLATLLLNAWLIGRLMIGAGEEPPTGKPLRVVSLNVLLSNPDKQRVLEYLRKADADVIFLMEVTAEWAKALEVLRTTHPHGLVEAREDNFGVALFSRVPLKRVKVIHLSSFELPNVQVRLEYQGKELMVMGTHPLPPVGPAHARERDEQLKWVAEILAKEDVDVLLVGDLNASPWSEGMRLITEKSLRLGPNAWRATWRAGSVLAIPIDHALCSGELMIAEKRVGRDVGSDHRPIEVDVYWR